MYSANLDFDHTEPVHVAVMMNEVRDYLDLKAGGLYVDGTGGAGGHSEMITREMGRGGKLICMDIDVSACQRLEQKFVELTQAGNVDIMHCNLATLIEIRPKLIGHVDGILLDVGLSSDQLNDPMRGFSFEMDGPLDMRFNTEQELTAKEILNTYSESDLKHIFRFYGDEPKSKPLARAIINRRNQQSYATTYDFRDTILSALKPVTRKQKLKIFSRNFQALRIAVNDELTLLRTELECALKLLKKGGRLAVISFHSGEDRVVKKYFREQSQDVMHPPEIPSQEILRKASVKLLTKKPLLPQLTEVLGNPRARSAKLRVVEKAE